MNWTGGEHPAVPISQGTGRAGDKAQASVLSVQQRFTELWDQIVPLGEFLGDQEQSYQSRSHKAATEMTRRNQEVESHHRNRHRESICHHNGELLE